MKAVISDFDTENEEIFVSVINEENISLSNKEDSSSDDDMSLCDGNCNQYKALYKLNCLCVLTKQENFVSDIIDKIFDKEKKISYRIFATNKKSIF